MKFSNVEQAIEAIARGEFVVVLDESSRENEGDLVIAAEHATPEALTFMLRHTSGVICVSVPGPRLDELEIPLMVPENTDSYGTAFTVTVDYRHGTSTGISASDRSATIRALADSRSRPSDFARPGHVFPLRARRGGVLRRPGHTEAASDLARLAGCQPLGALAEIMLDDGTVARRPELTRFARIHGLTILDISDLVAYRSVHDRPARVECPAQEPVIALS